MGHMRIKIVKESKYLKLIKLETPSGENFQIVEKPSFFERLLSLNESHATFQRLENQKEAIKMFNQLDKKYEKFEKGK